MCLIFCLFVALSVFLSLSLAQLRLEEETPQAELKDCIECDVPGLHLASLNPKSRNIGVYRVRFVDQVPNRRSGHGNTYFV